MVWWIVGSVIGIDQSVKWWVVRQGWFYVVNEGVAFSLGRNSVWLDGLIWLAFGVLIFLSIKDLVLNEDGKWRGMSWGLFLGGAVSNLIDRMVWGGVIDYISIGWFPVFNLADAGITVGVFFIIINIFLKKNSCSDDV